MTATPADSLGKEQCFHCGEDVPAKTDLSVAIDGLARPMCCIGCRSIAQAIVQAGGQAYYRQRTGAALDIKTLESLAPWISLLGDSEWAQKNIRHPDAQTSSAVLAIEGLRCGACAWLIERILLSTKGVVTARANASTARLLIQWDPSLINLPDLGKRISSVGYALLPIGSAPAESSRKDKERQALRRLFVAGLSAAQIMMYAYPEYLEGGALEENIRSLMRTASMLITVPVMVYSATPFFESAWRALTQKRLNMDVPVSLGLLIAFTASMWAWWTNTGEIYFDSVSMFVFLLLASRWVESRIRAKTAAQREKLALTVPTLAHRVQPTEARIAPWSLKPGDLVRVATGERIPADGILKSPTTDIDSSWLTGESLPLAVRIGDRLMEGSINLGPGIDVLIDTQPSESTLAKLSNLTEEAAADRPNWVAWADRIAGQFTLALLFITTLLILVSLLLHRPLDIWLASVIAVLVVTCPCALSMAGPAVYSAALAKMLSEGIAISSSNTIERLRSVTDVVLDKTGTLTDPAQSRVSMRFGDESLWPVVAAISSQGSHPLAKAIAKESQSYFRDPVGGEDIRQHPGLGLEGTVHGKSIRLGSASFTDPDGKAYSQIKAHPECTVFLSVDQVVCAGFEVSDSPREDAPQLITNLIAQGKTVWCVSGDRADRVAALSRILKIPDAYVKAGQTPQDKQAFAKELQREGRIVAMVGDGVNDAPVLAQADVSIAVQGAAPLAQQRADIYLIKPGLSGISRAYQIAGFSYRVLNQNLAWAVIYNLLAIPFAALGMISPLAASVGMAASSLIVVMNAARLLR